MIEDLGGLLDPVDALVVVEQVVAGEVDCRATREVALIDQLSQRKRCLVK